MEPEDTLNSYHNDNLGNIAPQPLGKKPFFSFHKIRSSFLFSNTAILAFVVVDLVLLGLGVFYFAGRSSTQKDSFPALSEDIVITPTPVPLTPSPSPINGKVTAQNSATDPTDGWLTYKFAALKLSLKYPPSWHVQVSGSSDGSAFRVQNFKPEPFGTDTDGEDGEYVLVIKRWKIGLKSYSEMKAQLSLDNGKDGTYDGASAGKIVVSQETDLVINGLPALSRVVSYTGLPSVQVSEVYIYDGKGMAILAYPESDITGGKEFYNQIISTLTLDN